MTQTWKGLKSPDHRRGAEDVKVLNKREARVGQQKWAGKGTCFWWMDVLVKFVLMKELRTWVYFLPSKMLSLSAFSLSPCCHEIFWGLSVREAEQGISIHPPGWVLAGTGQLIGWPPVLYCSGMVLTAEPDAVFPTMNWSGALFLGRCPSC